MKQTLTLLFIFLFSLLNAQSRSYKNDTEGLEPLGYSDDSRHFIEIINKTAVYDKSKKEVIAQLDGTFNSKEILLDKYLILDPLFDFKKKNNYSLLNIETGKHIDEKLYQVSVDDNSIYSISNKDHSPYKLDANEEWEEVEKLPSKKSLIQGWKIDFGNLEYKDYIINKEDKKIVLNGGGASYFYSCGPYLVFSKSTNTLIDTNGVVVKMDPEIIKDNLRCFDYISKIDFYQDLVDQVYSGEEYNGDRRFKVNDNLYFKTESGNWKYKDSKGAYHDLNYSELYSRFNSLLYGKSEGKYYYISTKDHSPIIELGSKYPRIFQNRFVWSRDQHRIFDFENSTYLNPEGSDNSYCSKIGYSYGSNGVWQVESFEGNKSMEFKGDEVQHITNEFISIVRGDKVFLYTWEGKELNNGLAKDYYIIDDKYFHSTLPNGQNTIQEIGGRHLHYPNYNTTQGGQDNIMHIHYVSVKVYDENKKFLYEIDNYKRHSKTGIYTYEDGIIEFHDFDGVKKKAKLDIFEQLKFNPDLNTKEDVVLDAKYKIKVLDSFLIHHPFELEAIHGRIEIGVNFLGHIEDSEFENLLTRVSNKYPEKTDVEMLENIVKGINNSGYRKTAISEVEKLLDNPDLSKDKHLFAQQDEYFYGLVEYHLGYLFHLEGSAEKSDSYKNEAFIKIDKLGFGEEFRNAMFTLY